MSSSASAAQPEPDPRGEEAAPDEPADGAEWQADGRDRSAATPSDRRPPTRPGATGRAARDDAVGTPAAGSGGDFLVSSHEREAAERRLRAAVADDLIDLDEFGSRMQMLLAARTRSELRAAVADLPAAPAVGSGGATGATVARPARYRSWVVSVMSGTETRGRWRPDEQTNAVAVMGGTTIDLQGAEFDGEVLIINTLAVMGGVEIIVPEGVEVDVGVLPLMGGTDVEVTGPIDVRTPLVRVRGLAMMGGVDVRHPSAKERRRAERTADDADRVPLRPAGYEPVDADMALARRARHVPGPAVARLRRWLATAAAAAVLALPIGWVASADEVTGSLFGSSTEVVTAEQLADGAHSVGTPVAFGSVTVQVPADAVVDSDGGVIFGSTDCAACATNPSDGPRVTVRTVGGFGSVEIVRAVPG